MLGLHLLLSLLVIISRFSALSAKALQTQDSDSQGRLDFDQLFSYSFQKWVHAENPDWEWKRKGKVSSSTGFRSSSAVLDSHSHPALRKWMREAADEWRLSGLGTDCNSEGRYYYEYATRGRDQKRLLAYIIMRTIKEMPNQLPHDIDLLKHLISQEPCIERWGIQELNVIWEGRDPKCSLPQLPMFSAILNTEGMKKIAKQGGSRNET
jgi:hypothetical protein